MVNKINPGWDKYRNKTFERVLEHAPWEHELYGIHATAMLYDRCSAHCRAADAMVVGGMSTGVESGACTRGRAKGGVLRELSMEPYINIQRHPHHHHHHQGHRNIKS